MDLSLIHIWDTPTPASDKKRALDTAIAQIEREFGKGSIMRLGENSHIMVEAAVSYTHLDLERSRS